MRVVWGILLASLVTYFIVFPPALSLFVTPLEIFPFALLYLSLFLPALLLF